jgi:hypothetical protein
LTSFAPAAPCATWCAIRRKSLVQYLSCVVDLGVDVPTGRVLVGVAGHIRQTAQMSTLSSPAIGRSMPEIAAGHVFTGLGAQCLMGANRAALGIGNDR